MNRRLLHTPEGVRDLYGTKCSDRTWVKAEICSKMKLFGYDEIDTPTFEFFDVFADEITDDGEKELYKFFDQDGMTMVLRPDFTPSVARCVSKYFLENDEPVRICYSGKTFLNTHSLQGKLKESTEIGAELMNDGSIYADAEMIALLVETISSTGLKDFKVSIGDADYYYGICEEAGIDFDTEEEIRQHLVNRNSFAADTIMEEAYVSPKYRELIRSVSTCIGNVDILSEAGKLVNNKRSVAAITHLENLHKVLCEYGIEEYISYDLGMLSKFNYYTGVMFGVYTYGVGDAIAKGGRYDNLLERFGKSAPSIGFMINLDDLMNALYRQNINLPKQKEPVVIEYGDKDFSDALIKAKKLRSEGKRVILKGANQYE